MLKSDKYKKEYFLPPQECNDWVKRDYITDAPIWCSVDLRDGNQALITPMSLEQKIEFFKFLVKLGFKEIEIGFPAASETEYVFTRKLIDENLIPDDVTIQVLTQSREHIIKKTFEALNGAKNAVVHFYNSTSLSQREQVFKKSKSEIIEIAKMGANMLKELSKSIPVRYQYSPESFTGTEPEFALEICNEVVDILKPTPAKKMILNLPVTVQHSMPHVYASQIEFMSKNLKNRDSLILSTHPHNDRGTAVADAELALLAGCQKVEGTLFGNGERTGNVDIITLALNMYSHGVDPKLDFSNMSEIVQIYEKLTNMQVNPRHPYAGSLVFTAFSGSHQDAIAKSIKYRTDTQRKYWDIPYLPIDPEDIGRNYDSDVIRINSQSGKGGISYMLEQNYGFNLPTKMREDFGYKVKSVSDNLHKELKAEDIAGIFYKEYVNISSPVKLIDFTFDKNNESILVSLTLSINDKQTIIAGSGNGQFNAAVTALQRALNINFSTSTYTEHALGEGSEANAAAYIGLEYEGNVYFATGINSDIMTASILALISCVNKIMQSSK